MELKFLALLAMWGRVVGWEGLVGWVWTWSKSTSAWQIFGIIGYVGEGGGVGGVGWVGLHDVPTPIFWIFVNFFGSNIFFV